jgi:hypothetical protein
MGLERTTFCMANASSRSLLFAPVPSKALLAAASIQASERERTRANAEPCHPCHGAGRAEPPESANLGRTSRWNPPRQRERRRAPAWPRPRSRVRVPSLPSRKTPTDWHSLLLAWAVADPRPRPSRQMPDRRSSPIRRRPDPRAPSTPPPPTVSGWTLRASRPVQRPDSARVEHGGERTGELRRVAKFHLDR